MDATGSVQYPDAPVLRWKASGESGEAAESDYDERERRPSSFGRRRPTVSPASLLTDDAPEPTADHQEHYVRLHEDEEEEAVEEVEEEHLEPSVVVLKNGVLEPRDPVAIESVPKGGGKLTFNLTPEQLGCRPGTVRPVRRLSGDGNPFRDLPPAPAGCRRPSSTTTTTTTTDDHGHGRSRQRKSSLRRGSMYGSENGLVTDGQLGPESLPASLKTVPMPAANPLTVIHGRTEPEDASMACQGPGSLPFGVIRGQQQQQEQQQQHRTQHKFDEISTVYDHFPTDFLAARYLCGLCRKLLREPRVLDCLHTFCRPCLESHGAASLGHESALFWHHINDNACFDSWEPHTVKSPAAMADGKPSNSNDKSTASAPTESRFEQLRTSLQSFREQNCLPSPICSEKDDGKGRVTAKVRLAYGEAKDQVLLCPTCNQPTGLAAGPGGIAQLPQHFVLARKIEQMVMHQYDGCYCTPATSPNQRNGSSPVPACRTPVYCELCSDQVAATVCCTTCALPLCSFCKEAHRRQRGTASHAIIRFGERLSPRFRADRSAAASATLQCPVHPEQPLKLFCTTCHQVICGECSTLLHRDHRCTTVARAGKVYGRFVRSAIEQTRPLQDYALQAVGKLNDLTVRVNSRCEAVQREVDAFVDEYVAALEEHRKSLAAQIGDIRQAKMEMIMAQRVDLERRTQDARVAIEFAEELLAEGSDVENLVFVSILLRRFEQCLQTTHGVDGRVTDTVQFLADEEAPSARVQTGIPLFGIVTTQKADPRRCTVEQSGAELATLKAHKRALLTLVVRDFDGRRLAHGGLTVQTDLRYRDDEELAVVMTLTDNRDGSYGLSFVPPRPGVLHLVISVDGKTIERVRPLVTGMPDSAADPQAKASLRGVPLLCVLLEQWFTGEHLRLW
ncbi:E3 ubiquitin-protein ligase TRIM71-like isoform X2 [Anopheles albimanus]|uniref:E3 ubiquitin-protein ligase TRIM71-like isoform X2 n=1 Tax=Anopheles albimanus TaxID=7167 RepID=UPI00163FFF61|nr:E3 ubiquitin-protein ligase TRIM71-like isoform X2 [Anopheles albimanus]